MTADPVVTSLATLDGEIREVFDKPERFGERVRSEFAARHAELRRQVRQKELAWSPRTIRDAYFHLHCCAVNLRVESPVLIAELEHGIERIQLCPPPRHGLPAMLLTLTHVSHDHGGAAHLAPRWVELVKSWEAEPKKALEPQDDYDKYDVSRLACTE